MSTQRCSPHVDVSTSKHNNFNAAQTTVLYLFIVRPTIKVRNLKKNNYFRKNVSAM